MGGCRPACAVVASGPRAKHASSTEIEHLAASRVVTPLRILLVDDYAPAAMAMAVALRQRGFLCARVGSPSDAIAAVEGFRPEIVLLEWALGHGAGLGLARQLRTVAEQYGGGLVVVAVTTQDEPAGFRAREQLDDYIVKPADLGALVAGFMTLARGSVRASVGATTDMADRDTTTDTETACRSDTCSANVDERVPC